MYRIHQPFYNARIESMSRARNNSAYVDNSEIINNVSQRNLAKVLIEFMNLQTKDVRTMISQELCGKELNRITCDISKDPPHYYISQGIDEGYLTFTKFMIAMERVKNRGFTLQGFRNIVQNYKSLPENSNERKQNKYKGMINCCILNGECSDSREIRNTFLGIPIGRAKTPRLCTISGGRRKKRRTRLTKKRRN
jgi:hypothetical protein